MSFCSSKHHSAARGQEGELGPRVGEDFRFTTAQEIQGRFPLCCLPPLHQAPVYKALGVSGVYSESQLQISAPCTQCQGPLHRHKAAWLPLALVPCPQGVGIGEIMLGLVGPKRLLKNTSKYCHFLLKSQLHFISIESGHKPSPTHSTELRTTVFKCFLHL